MTAVLATPPFIAFYDNNGDPLSGGLVYTYAAGTTTPKATFTDSTGLIEQTNPIVLDSAGRATWWISGSYKYIVKDSLGNTIRTTDNVTSFTTLADSADAFFQSFSGTGSQTAFTLSTDLGTDSKGLMIFLNRSLEACISNGNFATDTIWTKGAGWTIGAGVATAAGAISTAISQPSLVTIVAGQAYAVTYTITRSAGGLIPSIGGVSGVERTASGTYREIIVAGSTQTLAWTGNAFTGTLDDVSVTVASTAGYDILNPSVYTVNGTALTFTTAPALGTNNIYVFSPSTLLGAASSAAALAQTYAANALASQTAAAASASQAALVAKWRPAVMAATVAPITLSGNQTIDGISIITLDRVLVKDQINAAENGVYICQLGAWTRATDADTWDELVEQTVNVSLGVSQASTTWSCTISPGGTLGVTDVTWIFIQINLVPSATLTTPTINGNVSGTGLPIVCDGRLTLTTGVPVTTSDVTAATNVYFTPYKGNKVSVYTGVTWLQYTFTQLTHALGTITSGLPYDVFLDYNNGSPQLSKTAWSTGTARATALAYQDGVLVLSGTTTKRYLGTFYTTSTTTTEDSNANRYLWNYYNRVSRPMRRADSTSNWTYSTATVRQANGSTSNQLNFLLGVSEDTVTAKLMSRASNSTTTLRGVFAGIALDSVTVNDAETNLNVGLAANFIFAANVMRNYTPSAGRHFIAWTETGAGADTQTWYGGSLSFLSGEVLA